MGWQSVKGKAQDWSEDQPWVKDRSQGWGGIMQGTCVNFQKKLKVGKGKESLSSQQDKEKSGVKNSIDAKTGG